MAAPYVTPAGIQIPTVEEIRKRLITRVRSEIDPNIDVDADGIIGANLGIFASELREGYEFGESAYKARDPASAEDEDLDALCAITGTIRRPATYSTLYGSRGVLLDLDAGTTVPVDWEIYVAGDAGNRWRNVNAFTAPSDGLFRLDFRAINPGPVFAAAGTITETDAPISGINSITNDFDALPGRVRETDPELRIRREAELPGLGACTLDAIAADLSRMQLSDGRQPVLDAVVIENTDMVTSPDGLPPKSFSAILDDGQPGEQAPNDAIAQVIWDNKPPGIATYGNTTGTARDSRGRPRTVAFTRIALVPITITIDVSTSDAYPGNATLRQALVDASKTLQPIGAEAQFDAYLTVARAVPGVKVESITLDGGPAFTDSPCGIFERRTLATVDITIF